MDRKNTTKGREREYLNADGKRYRLVPAGTAKHHPDYKSPREKREAVGARNNPPKTIPVPDDVVARAYKYALELPTLEDISAAFGVSSNLLQKWRQTNPEIDIQVARARRRKTKSMIHVVEKKATKEEDLGAIKLWMQYFRKDLSTETAAPNMNVNLQLNVIPPPADRRDWLEAHNSTHLRSEAIQIKGTPVLRQFRKDLA